MAYNGYFPTNYGYGYQNPASLQAQMQAMQQQTQIPQAQTSGYIIVRSEEEARNYPVAAGNSITFFNETEPYCYKKTAGNSPLDRPDFKVYKIIEQEAAEIVQKTGQNTTNNEQMNNEQMNALKAEINAINDKYEALQKEIENIKETYMRKDGV